MNNFPSTWSLFFKLLSFSSTPSIACSSTPYISGTNGLVYLSVLAVYSLVLSAACYLPHKHWVCIVLSLGSQLSLYAYVCFVLHSYACYAPQTTGLCSAFPFGSLPHFHTFICYAGVLRLKQRVYVHFPSAPFPVCTRLFVMLVCFASQTTGLCNAFPFGSHSRLHTFVISVCFASQTPCLCCAVFLGLFRFVRLNALFVLYSEFCFAYFVDFQ